MSDPRTSRIRPSGVALLVVLAALLGFAGPAAAAPTLTASFEYSPAAPKPGQRIAFHATTTRSPTVPVQHAWDLDGDGEFDDAAGETATTSFATAGPHVVRLRAQHVSTAGGTTEDAAERTVQVGTSPPPPPPPTEPTDPPSAEPPASDGDPPPTAANQPPAARYERSCSKRGTLMVCAGLVAYEDNPFELDASPSSDADGQIVRYEWDLDADGTFETDAGASPSLTHTFPKSPTLIAVNNRDIGLRVTDDKGTTDQTTVRIRLREPACRALVKAGDLELRSGCLRGRDKVVAGKRVRRWTSEEATVINGITVVPAPGKTVTVDIPVSSGLVFPHVLSPRAAVSTPADTSMVALYDGPIDWKLVKHELRGFEIDPTARLNGLRVTGLAGLPRVALGRSVIEAYVALPEDFGGATSAKPVKLMAGGSSSAAKAAAARPLRFSVPNASLGPIGLDTLEVSFDGIDLWEIEASVALPAPTEVRISGDAGIRSSGDFDHAGATADFGSGLQVGGTIPVYLKRISFRVEINPKKSKCVPHTGVEQNPFYVPGLPGIPETIDYGHPAFALCGEVRLTGGPTVLDAAAIGLDGGLGFATYDDRPWVLRAFGELQVVEIPVADGELAVHGDGYIRLQGKQQWGVPDLFSIKGGLSLELFGDKFNASTSGDACIEFVDLCRGYRGVISSKGVAVCFRIDYEVNTWEPGIGYVWGESTPDLYFDGCDIGDYKENISRPASGRTRLVKAGGPGQQVDLPAGLPGAVIAVRGTDAPPLVTFTGPNGEQIKTPVDAKYVDDKRVLLLKDRRTNTTQVAIQSPSGGRWHVEVQDGSSPVASIKSAEGLPEPKVDAKVTGTGAQRDLRWKIEPRAGQTVRFVERGPSGGAQIAVAKGDRGSARFTPADGASEQRDVVAVIEQDGEPRDEIVVASYRAPGTRKPARPTRLRVKRWKTTLTSSWHGTRPGDTYEVRVRLADGRTLVRKTAARRLTLRRISRRLKGSVRVRAISASGIVGKPATLKLKQH